MSSTGDPDSKFRVKEGSLSVCADRAQRQEREVMLKLKEVVDKQRDELRAKGQEITTISKEAEAVRRNTHVCSWPETTRPRTASPLVLHTSSSFIR